MIIKGKQVDTDLINIHKSIADNLKDKDIFQSLNEDTATNVTELKPPIPMNTCLYIFKE